MIRVLMVEDSPSSALLLQEMLHSDPELRVVGVVNNGEEALRFIAHQKPDVVTMDIVLPGALDGYETTRRIMAVNPVPIVIISSTCSEQAVAGSFRAVEAGAVAILEKPPGPFNAAYPIHVARLVSTVKLMAGVKVVTRFRRSEEAVGRTSLCSSLDGRLSGLSAMGWPREPAAATEDEVGEGVPPRRVVAIGASTGGPIAIQAVLSRLPHGFPAPILIVQHISDPFVEGFAKWLADVTGFSVTVARRDEFCEDAHVYIAPDNSHLGITPSGHVRLSADPPEEGLRPAASYLFRSVAAGFGPRAAGVLLTGMGRDGSRGLATLRAAGGLCLAQNEASCAIFGMPAEALRLGAVDRASSLEEISATITGFVQAKSGSEPSPLEFS